MSGLFSSLSSCPKSLELIRLDGEHIPPKLALLHWLPVRLPVKSRIKFKILLITYKVLNNQAPSSQTAGCWLFTSTCHQLLVHLFFVCLFVCFYFYFFLLLLLFLYYYYHGSLAYVRLWFTLPKSGRNTK